MNSTALTSGEPTRLTALLIADPRPALRTGMELMSAVVSGATSSAMPTPNTSCPSTTSTSAPPGGTQVLGSATSRRHGGESGGMRENHSRPAAISAGPTVMNRRGPSRAAQVPAGVESVVSMIATGMPAAPAPSGEYPSVPWKKSPVNANDTYSAP